MLHRCHPPMPISNPQVLEGWSSNRNCECVVLLSLETPPPLRRWELRWVMPSALVASGEESQVWCVCVFCVGVFLCWCVFCVFLCVFCVFVCVCVFCVCVCLCVFCVCVCACVFSVCVCVCVCESSDLRDGQHMEQAKLPRLTSNREQCQRRESSQGLDPRDKPPHICIYSQQDGVLKTHGQHVTRSCQKWMHGLSRRSKREKFILPETNRHRIRSESTIAGTREHDGC